jgi:hypothetical protein
MKFCFIFYEFFVSTGLACLLVAMIIAKWALGKESGPVNGRERLSAKPLPRV